ncbi:MAG: Calx-beta domain-containing protein [Saccharospirillum sp.]|uniref:Calx-beta domain-containing protein n=1 Tax=Saccharospirillum sp. TaxID=2033801 RepID=UPI0032972565
MIKRHRFSLCLVVLAALLTVSCAPADSNQPKIQIATVTTSGKLEGNSGQSNLSFRVLSDIEQRIRYQTTNITAASNSDYLSTSGELLMRPGVEQTIDVPVLGDLQVEADEQTGLLLTYSDGSTSRHTGTIFNDDRPTLRIANQRVSEGFEGSTIMRFTIALSQTTLTPFPVRVLVEDASPSALTTDAGVTFQPADAGVDYQTIDQQLVIQSGANSVTFNVLILGDTNIEPDEAFSVKVFESTADPQTNVPLDSALGIITNDDGPGFNMPEVTLNNSQGQEGPAGAGNALSFPLNLSGPNEVSFSIFYEVIYPDSATSGFTPADSNDLPALSGKYMDIDGSGGEISESSVLLIPLTGDDQYELNDYFELVLTTETGYELDRARGYILNDDTPRFAMSDVTALEGNSGESQMRFTLTWDEPEPVAEAITLKYRTLDSVSVDISAATSGVDYSYKSDSLTFSPGDTTKFIDIPIRGDANYEPNEAFLLQISTVSGVPVTSASGLIQNDDAPQLIVTPTDGDQFAENTGTVSFFARFAQPVTQETTLFWVVDGGSATAGTTGVANTDITTTSLTGSAVYPEGSTGSSGMPVLVTINDDALVEDTESFSVSFYGSQADATNARAALYQSRISVIDNDTVLVDFSKATFRGQEGNVNGAQLDLESLVATEAAPGIRVYNGIISETTTVTMTVINQGSAEADDFALPAGGLVTITIPSGDYTTAQSLPIPDFFIISDNVLENDETLTLSLSNTSSPGLGIGTNSALAITIENDDSLVVGFNSTADLSGNEDSPVAIPSLVAMTDVASDYDPSGPGGQALAVTLDIANPGTAGQAERADFTPTLPVQLSITGFPINTGEAITSTLPTLADDDLVENTEDATLFLTAAESSLTSVDASRDRFTYTIISDDSVTLTLDTTPVSVDEGATANILIQISGDRLDADSPDLTFELAIVSATASSPSDYTYGNGLLTVPGGTDYSTGSSKSDWLDGVLTIESDDIVEELQSITFGLEPIANELNSVLSYTDDSAQVTLTIISVDTLSVGFQASHFESYENDQEPGAAVVVNGTTEIEVTLEFERTGGEAYPATEGVDADIATITVEPSHVSGSTFAFPAAASSDSITEFNEEMAIRIKTGAETGEPIDLLTLTEASWLLLNDDTSVLVNGSGINYCADVAGTIDADCDNVTEAALQSQDGKVGTAAFTASPPPQSGSDSASTPLDWLCRTDSVTQLTWAFEDSALPQSYQNSQVDQKITEMVGVCGVTDWRRPTFNELANLMVFTGETGLLDTSVFPGVQVASSADKYWFVESKASSTPLLMSFNQGQITTDTSGYLMLVSDSQSPLVPIRPTPNYACAEDTASLDASITSDFRYTLNVNAGEVTDNLTGLTWASRSLLTSDSNSTPTWATALEQADTYDGETADATGWRAPTIKELLSLVAIDCDSTGLTVDTNLPHYFLPSLPGGTMLPLMSSSPVNNASGEIWTLNLADESQMITRSAPPSGDPTPVEMQTFVVKTP